MKTFNLFSGQTDEVPPEAPGYPGRAARVGAKLGASRLGMSVYDLPPGEAIGPYHFEWTDEEWLIALEGQVTIRIPEGERLLDPGEVVCFPAVRQAPTRHGTQPTCQCVSRSSLYEERVWHRRVSRRGESGNLGGRDALHARPPHSCISVDLGPARSSFQGTAGPTTRRSAMKYLMLVCWDVENMNAQTEPDPTDTPNEESFPWLDDLQARGSWITGDQLAPPRRARSVRVRDGKAIVTDGPFAETKEAVGGFDIIECGSLEEAVEIAAGHPVAQMGTIEVRPLWGN
jgi:quercetin dioxygenase-like cupin family protein